MIKHLTVGLAVAVAFVAIAAGLKYAQSEQMLSAEVATRAMQVLIGLALAAYANLVPKDVGRLRGSPLAQARAQAALRVGGWSLTLAGIVYAALWAFAPRSFADVASMAVVAAGLVVTLGYAVRCFATRHRASDASI